MKQVKNISLILAISLSLASCSYSVYQVHSVTFEENQNEVMEPVTLDFSLWAEGGRLTVYVYNNTGQPIYVDWLYSTLSINEAAIPLYNETSYVDKQSISFSNTWFNMNNSIEEGKVENTLSLSVKNNRVDVVPPYSYRERTFFNGRLAPAYLDCDLGSEVLKNKSILDFTELNTPLSFSTMIGYCGSNPECETPDYVFKSFYVDRIINMNYKDFLGQSSYARDCDGRKTTTMVYEYPYRSDGKYYYQLRGEKDQKSGKSGGWILVTLGILGVATLVLAGI